MRVAIVGAGIAGLACARRLVAHDREVVVLEASDAPGGRVATMRTEIGGFDHGAQYFTARDDAFIEQVAAWRRAGVVAPWDVAVKSLAPPGASEGRGRSSHETTRWVGTPGMGSIVRALSDGLEIVPSAVVRAFDRKSGGPWTVRCEVGGESPFDTVVVAVPAEIATNLLRVAPRFATRAATARIEPCWALMVGFAEPIAVDEDRVGSAAFVNGGRLAWIARESSKPERRVGERWTLHAQSGWSVEHFDDDPEDIKSKLLTAFHEATGTQENPIYATPYRWRHALTRTALDRDHLWDPDLRVGVCGDWCRGYRVEDAWLSGTTLGDAIVAHGS